MKIFLHEINEYGQELTFNEKEGWVLAAVERVDENSDENPIPPSKARKIDTQLQLRKVDEVYLISGRIETHLLLLCSRCANSFEHPCKPQFSALFCKDPIMAGVGHLQKPWKDRSGKESREPGRPAGQNHGFARHAHDSDNDDLVAEGKDLDITYLSNDYIDLGDFLTEQLQLQVPFQPLCKEECKGMCSQCGTDLNLGRCACAKLRKQNPFSVLSDFKI